MAMTANEWVIHAGFPSHLTKERKSDKFTYVEEESVKPSATYEPMMDIEYSDCTHSAGDNGPSTTTGFFFATRFEGCYIEDARIEDCMFVNVQFIDCTFLDVMWVDIYLKDVTFTGCTFKQDLWRMDKWVDRSLENEEFENHTQLGQVIPAEITDRKWLNDQRAALTAPGKVLQIQADQDFAEDLQEKEDAKQWGDQTHKKEKRARRRAEAATTHAAFEPSDGITAIVDSDATSSAKAAYFRKDADRCLTPVDTLSRKENDPKSAASSKKKGGHPRREESESVTDRLTHAAAALSITPKRTGRELAGGEWSSESDEVVYTPTSSSRVSTKDSATTSSTSQQPAVKTNREFAAGLQALGRNSGVHPLSSSSARATTGSAGEPAWMTVEEPTSGKSQKKKIANACSSRAMAVPVGNLIDFGESSDDLGQAARQSLSVAQGLEMDHSTSSASAQPDARRGVDEELNPEWDT